MHSIGETVRRLRQARGLSKEQLATLVGYANATMIHQIEHGLKLTSTPLAALAKALGVTVSDLVGDKGTCGVTNNANGDHQVVYQHVEGALLMVDELQRSFRAIVQEELAASREVLVEELRKVVREVVREGEPQGEEH